MFRRKFLEIDFAQNNLTVPIFDEFLSRVGEVDRIIEVGTGCGIFTVFLGLYCYYSNKILITYDIKNGLQEKTKSLFDVLKIDYRIKDIFDNLEEIGKEIKKVGKTIVLCDNGNKIQEFNIFSCYLKKGDFILAHDYARDLKVFTSEIKSVYWDWHEISDSKIEQVCKEQKLVGFMDEEFQRCAWVCKQKVE